MVDYGGGAIIAGGGYNLGVVLVTTVATAIDLGAGPLTPQGSTDLLIARFAP